MKITAQATNTGLIDLQLQHCEGALTAALLIRNCRRDELFSWAQRLASLAADPHLESNYWICVCGAENESPADTCDECGLARSAA